MSTELMKVPDMIIKIEEEIAKLKVDTAINLLKLGALLKVVRDEKLYKKRDYNTFESYIAQPEIGIARSTVYMWIHFYELYVQELHYQPEIVGNIPVGNLQLISPVVKEDPDEWMNKANVMSKSDLRDEVREYKGLPPKEIKYEQSTIGKGNGESESRLRDFDTYLGFVRAHRCCVCNHPECDAHHFPRTRGAGGRDHQVIPLCRSCHTQYHQDPTDFWLSYRTQIMDYFYDTILKAYNILSHFSVPKV